MMMNKIYAGMLSAALLLGSSQAFADTIDPTSPGLFMLAARFERGERHE